MLKDYKMASLKDKLFDKKNEETVSEKVVEVTKKEVKKKK